jgi:CRISPR/Cas system-associated exonuclease Cas4 (RecB family)
MDPPNFFRAAREAICVPKEKLIRALREIPSGQGYPEKLAEMVYRGAISVFLISYNREEVLSRLRWAKAYWTNERKKPMSAQNPKKCETCVFADKCPSSLSPRPPHKVDG